MRHATSVVIAMRLAAFTALYAATSVHYAIKRYNRYASAKIRDATRGTLSRAVPRGALGLMCDSAAGGGVEMAAARRETKRRVRQVCGCYGEGGEAGANARYAA